MNIMFIGVGTGLSVVTMISGWIGCKIYRLSKEYKYKQKQIQSRVNEIDKDRAIVVNNLNGRLRTALDERCAELRFISIAEAQQIVDDVFFDWMNHNFGLFGYGMPEQMVRITKIHNGIFYFELPECLKLYTGK